MVHSKDFEDAIHQILTQLTIEQLNFFLIVAYSKWKRNHKLWHDAHELVETVMQHVTLNPGGICC